MYRFFWGTLYYNLPVLAMANTILGKNNTSFEQIQLLKMASSRNEDWEENAFGLEFTSNLLNRLDFSSTYRVPQKKRYIAFCS